MSRNRMLPLAAMVFIGLTGMSQAADARRATAPGVVGKPQAEQAASAYQIGSGPMTPAQRGQATRAFVKRWGPYFQRTTGESMTRWAMKHAQLFAIADADNIRTAMGKQTMEAASLALRGLDLSDEMAIDHVIAKAGESGDISAPLALGDVGADLVFTPLEPCRIFDTRNAGGVITSGGVRSFDTYPYGGSANFQYQGGTNSGNCGVAADAAAVVINVAAPNPSSPGFLTIYPYGSTRPVASNLDYSAGELKNNEVIARSANGTYDISVYAHGATHVVGDVVGYFIRPQATALQCVDTADAVVNVAAGGTANAVAPACAAGYVQTATNCESSTWQMPFVYFSGGTCSAQNNAASAASLRASRTCCRVPGR